MFSWFTSPDLETARNASAEEATAGSSPAPLSVTPGFHPIVLPASPVDRPAAAGMGGDDSYQPPASLPREEDGLFGGLDLNPRSRRRPVRARRSPSSLSVLANGTSPTVLDNPCSAEGRDGGGGEPLATSAGSSHSSSFSPSPPSSTSAFAFLPAEQTAPSAPLPAPSGNSAGKPSVVANAASSSTRGVSQDAAHLSRMRSRLERFYREYNPGKLPEVEATMARFATREDELFTALVKKYGPEPTTLRESELVRGRLPEEACADAEAGCPSGLQQQQQHPDVAPSESAASAFDFLNGERPNPEGDMAVARDIPRGHGHDGGAASVASRSSHVDATTTTTTTTTTQDDDEVVAKASSPVAAATAACCTSEGNPEATTLTSEGEEVDAASSREAILARQAAEQTESAVDVSLARGRLTAVVRAIASAVEGRNSLLRLLEQLQGEVDHCVAAEQYDRAEAATQEIALCVTKVKGIDEELTARARALPALRRDLEKRILRQANLLSQQKVELREVSTREAQRLRALLDEVNDQWEGASHLQSETERVAEEARRGCSETADALRAKLAECEAEMRTATQETRSELETVERDISSLDDEIAQLESRLAVLREQRDSNQRKARSLSEKLVAGERSHRLSMQHVEAKLGDVAAREADIEADTQRAHAQVQRTKDALDERRAHLVDALAASEAAEADTAALGLRARQLEEEVIPLLSAATESLVSLLERRQGETARVVLGAATGQVAGGEGGELERRCAALSAKVGTLATREAALALSLQRLRESLPILEAAKAAAVAAKQFKVAQEKVNELKGAAADIDRYEDERGEVMAALADARSALSDLQLQAEAHQARTRERTQTFLREHKRDIEEATAIFLRAREREPPGQPLGTHHASSTDPRASVATSDKESITELDHALYAAWHAISEELKAAERFIDPCTPVEEDAAHSSTGEAGLEPPAAPTPAPLQGKALAIGDLEAALAKALACEDYEACEALQAQIDALSTA